jgi:hypothetical protein
MDKVPNWKEVNWRTLKTGEMTEAGDWYFDDYERDSSKHQWLQVEEGSEREAPDTRYTAHYTYRRLT